MKGQKRSEHGERERAEDRELLLHAAEDLLAEGGAEVVELAEDELNCSGEQQEHDEHEQVRTEIFALVNAREPGQRFALGTLVRRVRRGLKHGFEPPQSVQV